MRAEWVLGLGYVLLRVLLFAGTDPARAQDTLSYLEVARLDPFSSAFLGGPRAPTVPLLYKILGSDDARAIAQLVASVACWLALAAALAIWIERRWVRIAGFGSILVLSLAPQITHWDSILLTESLSLSLTAALCAAWLWYLRDPGWRRLAVVVAVSLAWVFTRDTNAYLAAFVAVVLLISAPFATRRRFPLAAAASMVVLCVLSLASAGGGATAGERAEALSGPADGSFGRTAAAKALPAQQYVLFGQGRWEFPLLSVIGRRVLTDPDRLDYFKDHGMPVTPALEQMSGQYAAGRSGEFFRSPQLASFRSWLGDSGQSTYTGYLLTHPAYLVKAFTEEPRDMLFIDEAIPEASTAGGAREHVRDVIPEPLRRAMVDSSGIALALWLATGAATVFLVATRAPRRSWIVPLAMLVSTLPHMIVVWHGDANEVQRHSLMIAVTGRLALLMLLFLALDSPRREGPLLPRRERAPATAA